MQSNQYQVPATSTLIMQYAGEVYNSPLEQQYLSRLNYSQVGALGEVLENVYPLFKEVILLRKRSVRSFLRKRLIERQDEQVCILGAGLDPLAIHLLSHYDNQIRKIFEVDSSHTAIKQELYTSLGLNTSKIAFVNHDLATAGTLTPALELAGFDPHLPTTIIFEGVLHYITNEEFVRLMKLFSTPDKRNKMIMDYTLDPQSVPFANRPVHQQLLEIFETFIQGRFNRNNRGELLQLTIEFGAVNQTFRSMQAIQAVETGRSKDFHDTGDGLIEMVFMSL
ncbi:class I SAM-dependent methyltransferase [Chitinophaga sp. sic0106]|uniref:class I SAM-dependent methyltransferase n=1 Tax=Chitinophaga sp. sic0106 TaxID=2854785 RepID=UPI001C444E96|nr:class I SAM-dependent methyltransferase [Chitinophaga sp. sic0106]MBV7533254.1 class I SAM-dependent methyltransferase [Chitinophaga sp. sic0106]